MRLLLRIVLILLVIGMVYYVATLLTKNETDLGIHDSNTGQNIPADNASTTPTVTNYDQGPKQALVTNSGSYLAINRFSDIPGSSDAGSNMYHLDTDYYGVLFNEYDGSFAVNISKKPLLETRDLAVKDLASLLGISPVQLCDLNIFISTTKDFDKEMGGKDFGLGVCFN